ncbi:MAG: gliding motility-associated C-terminal domain-containing protein [Bacteroidetes bacterium]|nr:gliding motility-associated C-terminal domain-containing protein [Bacteroidota bacterium]
MFIVIFFGVLQLHTQINLVPNASFEDTINCDNWMKINYAKGWFQPQTPHLDPGGSSDLFHECSSMLGVPSSIWGGYQYAKTGKSFSGIVLYVKPKSFPEAYRYREYIENKLIMPLKKDVIYCIGFHINLSNSSVYAVSNIGIYLSNDSTLSSFPKYGGQMPYYTLPYKPQLENDFGNIIKDTLDWVKLEWEYKAIGGEQFITIGNFYDAQYTFFEPTYTNTLESVTAYYYIDDVFVYRCNDTLPPPAPIPPEQYVNLPNAFSPNADGENDVFHLLGADSVAEMELRIYNRWGQEVFYSNQKEIGWDGNFKGQPAPTGVYAYTLVATLPNGEIITKKGNVTLKR